MNRPLLRRSDLRETQLEIGRLVEQHPALMVVLKMAGGKTGALLTVARDMLDSFEARRVLVLAPKRVACNTWPHEIVAWEHTRILSVAVASGTAAERAAAVDRAAEITVTNFENLVWLYNHVGGARGWPYDFVIVDESSRFKAGKKRTRTTKRKTLQGEWLIVDGNEEPVIEETFRTERSALKWLREQEKTAPDWRPMKRTRLVTKVTKGGNLTRFGAIARVRHKIDRMVLLTGTPGDHYDLWGQFYLVDLGQRLGRTQSEFEERYFTKNPHSYEIKARPGAEADIMSQVSDVMFSLPPPKDLPEPTFVPVPVHMPPAALDEYKRFRRTLVSEMHDVEAVSRGVLAQKLLQFANGSMYREDRSVVKIHDAKLDALDELIAEAAGDPMLVFYGFKFDLAQIRARHPKAVVLNESSTAEDDWNAGKIKLLLAHPASCAHGLNLQFGGHLACWYGFTWSLELYQQANARLPRPGQKWPVAIYQIIAEGTDDRRLLSVLDDQAATQEDLTATVRRIIQES